MKVPSPDIAALLGSRICHDLISPIGAISNGVELLQMAGGAPGPELELISQSVANANARIRYFRVAFGAASADQMMGETEIREILGDYTGGSRLRINWATTASLPRNQIKLVFLMLQCLETAMPWGGQITVECSGGNWTISATSDRMKYNEALWASLSDPELSVEFGPAEVQFLMLSANLQMEGRQIELEVNGTGLIARF